MFHIQPTPISWVLWLAMFAVPIIIIIIGIGIYFVSHKAKLGNIFGVIGLIGIVVVALLL